ncbi:MAG: protein phosphatase 2C domain-containing protein [Clostridia bacterium]|nr:protein phosphatase 2C domain-containing protein [Clostridia bacterium]
MICKLTTIDASAVTNKGLVRTNNEDNFYMNGLFMEEYERDSHREHSVNHTSNNFLFALCDGMGGENQGEKAALIAVTELKKFHSRILQSPGFEEKLSQLNIYVKETNDLIYNTPSSGFINKMGTTFACLLISEGQAAALHLGDSRVYHLRGNTLQQLTTDHTEAERLIRLGILTREQASHHKSRNRLSRHFGVSPEEGIMEADISHYIHIDPGDVFLICTDGLTSMVCDDKIRDILSKKTNSLEISHNLVNEALKNGGLDNVTAITIRILEVMIPHKPYHHNFK